jgi:uncharacterized protein YegL
MTDKNLTEIVAIIDRSGSMGHLTTETISGYNSFLEEQKKTTGKAKITLVQFDDQYQIDYEGVDINDAKPLTTETYKPRGYTALNDAIGRTIIAVGERLAKTPDDERPGQVIFLVITDGEENSSKEYQDPTKVSDMVKHQTEKYSWTFTFMGGGDATLQKKQAYRLGVSANNTYNYSANSAGTSAVYGALSKGLSRRRNAVVRGLSFDSDCSLLEKEEIDSLKQD